MTKLPRATSGDILGCLLVTGGSAVDCPACGGRCPDAVRLFQQAAGAVGVRALEDLSPVHPDSPLAEFSDVASFAHTSETAEHMTPYDIVGSVTEALGGAIDLDPASNARANEYIEAGRYFDAATNGLKQDWHGRVFLNPPGGLCDGEGRPVYPRTRKREGCSTTGACGLAPGHKHEGVTSSAKFWWFKLAREWASGRLKSAVFLGFSVEQLCNTQTEAPEGLLLPLDAPLCFPDRRLRYLRETDDGDLVPGDNPPHASFLAYLGEDLDLFERAFKRHGRVLVGHHDPDAIWPPKLKDDP